jgi:predicted amidohydrolase
MGAMTEPITVAAVQMHARPTLVEKNLSKAAEFVSIAASRGARLAVLPELFNVGYFVGPRLFDLWEDEDGRSVTWMREEARRNGLLLAGSIAERRDGRLYNTMFIAEPDGRLHRHVKRTPTVTEQAAFDAGDDDPVAVTSLGRIGQLVCAEAIHASCLRPLADSADIVIFSQSSFAPRWIGRAMCAWERRTSKSLIPATKILGAPWVCAGMIGPVQRLTRLLPSFLYGGTYVTDAEGRLLDRVEFGREGVAVAAITPGNNGGNVAGLVDPGRWRAMADRFLVHLPDLRPSPMNHRDAPAGALTDAH